MKVYLRDTLLHHHHHLPNHMKTIHMSASLMEMAVQALRSLACLHLDHINTLDPMVHRYHPCLGPPVDGYKVNYRNNKATICILRDRETTLE